MENVKSNKKLRPIDAASTIFLIDVFGEQFYNVKSTEKQKLLEHIALNFQLHGKFYTTEEINSKFTGLRRSYNKYRKELDNGHEIKWKHYNKMHMLLRNKFLPRQAEAISDGSPNGKMEPEIELTEYESEENTRKRVKFDVPFESPQTSSGIQSSQELTPPAAHSMHMTYDAYPYNYAAVLKKQQAELLQRDDPAKCFAVNMYSPTNLKRPAEPTPKAQPTRSNTVADSNEASDIASIMKKLIEVQTKHSEVKKKRQELAKTEADLETEYNNLMSLALLKMIGAVFTQK